MVQYAIHLFQDPEVKKVLVYSCFGSGLFGEWIKEEKRRHRRRMVVLSRITSVVWIVQLTKKYNDCCC